MDINDREGVHPNTGGEQTSFGSDLDPSSETGTSDFPEKSGRVRRVASSGKEKASGIPAMLADGLQAGAEALRQRRASPEGTVGGSSVAIASDPTIAAVTDTLASGMQSSADWLRDADIDKLKEGVEKQVKEHPDRKSTRLNSSHG